MFTFAGTKDRRASTVQQVCAYRLPADQLRRTLTHRMWDKRLRISRLEYRAERLRLGDLQGNCFHVALRGVPGTCIAAADSASSSVVDQAFSAIKSGGFLNYFGLQRFGTRSIRTHAVGAALISSCWERAVRLILGEEGDGTASARKRRADEDADVDSEPPTKVARTGAADNSGKCPESDRSGETAEPMATDVVDGKPEVEGGQGDGADDIAAAAGGADSASDRRPKWQLIRDAQQLFLQTGDAQKALDAMPRSQHLERCILGALARQLPPAEALRQLPHQALALYAHAAQGLVWNAVLSRRIRDFGPKPVIGDLVFVAASDSRCNGAVPTDDVELFVDGEDSGNGAPEEEEATLPPVRQLKTPDDVSGVALSDIVLPLPGSEVEYPPHLEAAYESVCKELLGLSLSDFHNSKLVLLRGAYRPAMVLPSRVEWQVVAPEAVKSAAHGALMPSDVSKLLEARELAGTEANPTPSATSSAADADVPLTTEAVVDVEGGGSSTGVSHEQVADAAAVVFKCVLPPSAYLTMMLREVVKRTTE